MKKEKGITLIALIITIIVIVILVAVTITLATEGGIFGKAKNAANSHIIAAEKEKINIALAVWKMEKEQGKSKTFEECLKQELEIIPDGKNEKEATVTMQDEKTARVTFTDSGNSYIVTDDGEIELDKSYIISYELKGGTNPEGQVTSYKKGDTVSIKNPSKENAYFDGWYETSDYSGESIGQITGREGNIKLYAKWIESTQDDYFTWTVTETEATVTGLSTDGLTAYNGNKLTTLAIPSTHNNLPVTKINQSAFNNKSTIKVLCIPDSVTSIGNYAFTGVSDLEELTIPISTAADGYYSNGAPYRKFSGATKLKKLHFTPGTGTGVYVSGTGYTPWYDGRANEIEVILDEGIESLGGNLFYNCPNIKIAGIPSSLISIGNNAFYGCTGLTNEDINMFLNSNITTYGESVFSGCTGITGYINLGNIAVSKNMFSNCTGLEEVSVNGNIAINAFSNCSNLKKITIGDNATIRIDSFSNVTGLEELTMPISTKVDGYYSNGAPYRYFSGTTKLKKLHFTPGTGTGVNVSGSSYTPWYDARTNEIEVILDEGITSIGANMFKNCTGLNKIIYRTEDEDIECTTLSEFTAEFSGTIGTDAFKGTGLSS